MLNQLWVLGRKMKSDGTLWNIKVYNITLTKVAQRIDYKISITPLPRESSRGLLIVVSLAYSLTIYDDWIFFPGKKITLNVKLFIFFYILKYKKNNIFKNFFKATILQFRGCNALQHHLPCTPYISLRDFYDRRSASCYISFVIGTDSFAFSQETESRAFSRMPVRCTLCQCARNWRESLSSKKFSSLVINTKRRL